MVQCGEERAPIPRPTLEVARRCGSSCRPVSDRKRMSAPRHQPASVARSWVEMQASERSGYWSIDLNSPSSQRSKYRTL